MINNQSNSKRNIASAATIGAAALTINDLVNAPQAKALPFTDVLIGTDFKVSGDWADLAASLQIDYIGPVGNDGLYGNQVKLDDVNFGGALTAVPFGWTSNTTSNPSGSTNYQLNSQSGNVNIRGPPFNFAFDYAPQNGNPVPAGIGSEALLGQVQIGINNSVLETVGYIPAPLSIANSPQTVPEPGTLGLMILGVMAVGGKKLYDRLMR